MKISLKRTSNSRSSRMRSVLYYACISLLACASLSVQAERIRSCTVGAEHFIGLGPSVSGLDYNGDRIADSLLSTSIYTAGRHGGIQANTARKRAVSRFKTCAEELVNNPNKRANNIPECDNSDVGSSARDMVDLMSSKSMNETLVCRLGFGGNTSDEDFTFFIKANTFSVSGRITGDKYCSSDVVKTNTVSDQDVSSWNCNEYYYDRVSLSLATSTLVNSAGVSASLSPFEILLRAVLDIKVILQSESDVEKIFGEGHQVKANELLTIIENAENNTDAATFVKWLPNLSLFNELNTTVELAVDDDSIATSDVFLQTAYSRLDRAIFIGHTFNDLYPEYQEFGRCAYVQALAHHVSHYFDDFNGLTEERGGEGKLAELRVCDQPLFDSLTDSQIATIQTEIDYGDVLFNGKYYLNDLKLGFNMNAVNEDETF